MSSTSQIHFMHDEPEQYVLLQLSPELLDQEIVIKSASANSTVLCTHGNTYRLRDVQQSNSLLFLNTHSIDSDLVYQGEATSWLETTLQSNPKIHLANLPTFTGEGEAIGIASKELFASIPASYQEIHAALRSRLCLDLGNGYIQLDRTYVLRLLCLIVNVILSAELDLSDFDRASCHEAITQEEENVEVMSFLLDSFSLRSHRHTSTSDSNSLHTSSTIRRAFNGEAVVKYAGISTLSSSARRSISLDRFYRLWTDATPPQYQVFCKDLTLLIGYCVQPVSSQIRYLDRSDLSSDAKLRIAQLLDVRERWPESEMIPWLEDIADGPKAVQAILLKHARKVKVGKTIFIESRNNAKK